MEFMRGPYRMVIPVSIVVQENTGNIQAGGQIGHEQA
jgi:hypothetical protein